MSVKLLTGQHLGVFKLKKGLHMLVWVYTCQNVWKQPEISNNVVCATSRASDQPVHTHSLIRAFASRLNIRWVLSTDWTSFGAFKLKRGLHGLVVVYTCQNCWKSHIAAHFSFRERSGSVIECLTRDRGPRVRASPASLCCVLEQEH